MSNSSGPLSDDEIRYIAERAIINKRRLFAILGLSGSKYVADKVFPLQVGGVVSSKPDANEPADRL